MIGRFVPKNWDTAGFKMLVSKFGTFGTQTRCRYHKHKQSIDRRKNCTKTNKMRYLVFPVSCVIPCASSTVLLSNAPLD